VIRRFSASTRANRNTGHCSYRLSARGCSTSSDAARKLVALAISSLQAEKIEARLRELGLEPETLHDWVMRRVYRADEDGRRITHYTRVRGSHGEAYVWDPEGTHELPAGYEAPRPPLKAAE
jgi:hypothetical protein